LLYSPLSFHISYLLLTLGFLTDRQDKCHQRPNVSTIKLFVLKNVRILLVKKLFSIFRFSPWKSASDDKNTSYMIRLCGSLTTGGSSDCHSNTHIWPRSK
jgi:hypothetical protein